MQKIAMLGNLHILSKSVTLNLDVFYVAVLKHIMVECPNFYSPNNSRLVQDSVTWSDFKFS